MYDLYHLILHAKVLLGTKGGRSMHRPALHPGSKRLAWGLLASTVEITVLGLITERERVELVVDPTQFKHIFRICEET